MGSPLRKELLVERNAPVKLRSFEERTPVNLLHQRSSSFRAVLVLVTANLSRRPA
jgi:hypothetical protein